MDSTYSAIQDSDGHVPAVPARHGQQHSVEFDSLAVLMPHSVDSVHGHKRADSDVLEDEERRATSSVYSWRDCTRCFRSEQSPLLFIRVVYSRFQHRLLLHHRLYLSAFLVSSVSLVVLLYYFNGFAASTAASSHPSIFTCHNVLWAGADACGYMAHDCQPFTSEPFDVRCAARCDWPNLSHRTIGAAPHYRPDSYVCAAAIHAGLIGTHGGCLRVAYNGPYWGFVGRAGSGGMVSQAYDSWFPVSFTVVPADGASHCEYFHWSFLFVGLTLFFLLCLMRPPPLVLFYSLLLYGYYYVAATMGDSSTQESVFFTACERLFYVGTFGYCMYKLGPAVTLTGHDDGKMDDRQVRAVDELVDDDSSERDHTYRQSNARSRLTREDSLASSLFNAESPASTASSSFSRPPTSTSSSLLTCTPCRAWWLAYRAAPFTLHLPSSLPLGWYELYFLYCVPCFAALHFGYLSMVLPDIDLDARAFSHGLGGAIVILFFSALTLVLLVSQARLLFSSGQLRLYGLCYSCVAVVIVLVSAMWYRTYSFHLHHVLVAPLLFPLTRFRSRLSLVAQALLLGLFLNGFALWGFSADWDYTPPASPATIDSEPPSVLYVRNATGTTQGRPLQQEVVWSLRNDTGSALGSSLYLNGVQLFHASFSDTKAWWNGTFTPPLSFSLRAEMAGLLPDDDSVIVHLGSRHGVPHIHRYDRARSPRLYRQSVVAHSTHTDAVSLSASHPSASSSVPTAVWANVSTGGWMGVASIPPLVGGWNYTLQACYTFTYGSTGPCTDPLLLVVPNSTSSQRGT